MKNQESKDKFSPQDTREVRERYLQIQRRNEEVDRSTDELVIKGIAEVSEQYAIRLYQTLDSLKYFPF